MAQVNLIQNLVGGWSVSDVRIANLSDSINLYVETQGDGAASTQMLRSICGSTRLLQLSGPCRGIFQASRGLNGKPVLFAVFGHSLYVIRNTDEAYELTKDLTNTNEPVSMTETGGEGSANPHLIVVDGASVWAVNTELDNEGMKNDIRTIALPYRVRQDDKSNPVVRIQPTHCAYCYNYLIVNDKDTDAFYISYQYPFERTVQGTSQVDYDIFMIDSVRAVEAGYKNYGFITYAEWRPDNISALISNSSLLYTFGPKSTQIFTYNNDVDAPFVSPTNAANSIGIKAPKSLCCVGDYVFWLGASEIGENGIYQWKGNALSKISNPEIEHKIGTMKNPSDAVGQCWTETGHMFYALTFNDDDYTLVYDLTEGLWHRRSTKDELTAVSHKWRLGFAKLHNNKLLFGTDDGSLVYLDYNKWKEYDDRPIIRLRRSGMMLNNYHKFFIDGIKLICNTGDFKNQQLLQEDKAPHVMLRWSEKGGPWSNQRLGGIGKQGEYSYQVDWYKLGLHSICAVEISISDNVNFALLGGKIQYSLVDRF